jgi:hypothetical protein
MSHFPNPSHLLCLSCGTLLARSADDLAVCTACGAPLDRETLGRLYEYAAEVYYYGCQYRSYYESAYASGPNPIKPSLSFAGEALAWVTLAVLSGVLGNAAYDAVKAVVAKMRSDIADGKVPNRDYSRLLELTDDQLGALVDAARSYCGGMDGLTKEVRAAIVEEIMAHTISHDPALVEEMTQLMQRNETKLKHRKRFAELLRAAVVQSRDRSKPPQGMLDNLWSRLKR